MNFIWRYIKLFQGYFGLFRCIVAPVVPWWSYDFVS